MRLEIQPVENIKHVFHEFDDHVWTGGGHAPPPLFAADESAFFQSNFDFSVFVTRSLDSVHWW